MLMIDNQPVGLREFYAGQAAHAYAIETGITMTEVITKADKGHL